ncbi:MAG: hypothetical protein D6693_09470 [Planctomycetota bacterium]|nr:MAG: hypothetical protein D6693_09470 [Planctomycetota bacterium]
MTRTTTLSLLAGATAGLVASGALADAATPAGASNDEIRAMVADMLADAETRSSLLQAGGTAGHDGKFFLASPDGAFRLNVGGQIQFRYVLNFRDDGGNVPIGNLRDDFESGFQTRRTKLTFDGTVYNDMFFKIQGIFNRAGGGFALEDAYVGYDYGNGFKAIVGQFKSPFSREQLVSSKRQLAVDRSFVDGLFNAGRVQGIMVTYSEDTWRTMLSFNDGERTANTDFITNNQGVGGVRGGEGDWGFSGRFEYLGGGSWDQFKDFSSARGSEGLAWMLGAALEYQDGAADLILDNGGSLFSYTFDASLEGDGWNAFGAFIGRHVDNEFTDAGSADQYGFVVQGGIFVTEDIEPFVRWDTLLPDTGSAFNTITFGANWYIHGHAAKFTLDVQWFLDAPASVGGFDKAAIGANTGIGFLGSGIEEDEFAVRAQFQLLF